MVVMLLLSIKSSCIETKLNDIYRLELAKFMHELSSHVRCSKPMTIISKYF